MLRLALCSTFILAAVVPSSAVAQPGQWTPTQAPAPAVQLTPEEHEILQRGEISIGKRIGGGIVGTAVGYGIGHAVQGRWSETGWIFTLGEGTALTVFMVAFSSCIAADFEGRAHEDRCAASLIGSGVALLGFRIWEIVDVWTGPSKHNRKVRELKQRTGQQPFRYGFYAAPTGTSSGVAGLTLQF